MSHYTPGPWNLVETEPGIDAEMDVFVTTPRYAGGRGLVARVMDADDAVLIAAAPDLFEALETIAAGNTDPDRMVAIARAALAKAEGQ